MKRVAFTTLGCKANWVDGEALCAALKVHGIDIVPFDEAADAYVVNTCTVTQVADRQSRQMLRRARRNNPGAVVVATGCAGEIDRKEIGAIEGVDAVFGTSDRDELVSFLLERLMITAQNTLPLCKGEMEGVDNCSTDLPHPSPPLTKGRGSPQSRARAFLKIQDGCDRSCAYCIVPRARGAARSVPISAVIDSCRTLAKHHNEIVLTGIDIGQYGRDLGTTLHSLLEELVARGDLPRLRLSSIDPSVVDDRLIEILSSGRICRHIHLSIQSGSDSVLKGMGRAYRAHDLRRAVCELAGQIHGVAVTGDVIAGFPGEAGRDHDDTLSLLSELPLAGLHVFPYSPRARTRAAAMSGQISQQERTIRAAELRELAVRARRRFLESQTGQTFGAIVTSRGVRADGTVEAFTDNAISIALPGGVVGYGEIGSAVITDVEDLKARGKWHSHQTTRLSSNVSRKGSAISSNAGSI